MLMVIFICLIAYVDDSQATHHRFWIGYRNQNLSQLEFINGLNKLFFKETVLTGKGKGLISYQPYVTHPTQGAPDEIALVSYRTEKAYKAIRKTARGVDYANLHGDYFDMMNSKSFVVQPYKSALELNNAYQLHPTFKDWKRGFTFVAFYESPSQEKGIEAFRKAYSALKPDKEINDSIVIMTPKWVFEYRSLKSSAGKFVPLPLKLISSARSNKISLDGAHQVREGEGVNFQF